ncbi:MAG: hypothetical protein HC837_16200 [Chloroflexaceae bacterium]|nr:hypothetical protein [Chloroflexaceae bacterium]
MQQHAADADGSGLPSSDIQRDPLMQQLLRNPATAGCAVVLTTREGMQLLHCERGYTISGLVRTIRPI